MSGDKQGPPIEGNWVEVDPHSLLPTIRIGDMDVGNGRKWEFGTTWNSLGVVVSTDLPVDDDGSYAKGISHKRFLLNTGPLIQKLAKDLLA